MKGVELKVKHSVRNVKKFMPSSELKLMELDGTTNLYNTQLFVLKFAM